MAATSRFTGLKGSPDLRSASALVLDASGNVIYGKDATPFGRSPRSPS